MSDDGRYSRQVSLPELGEQGQQKFGSSHAVIIGCGGLGSAVANALVRTGVGRIRLVDPDDVELSNLHRQMLFDEDDLAAHLPKAEAARRKLERINSEVAVEAVVEQATAKNIEALISDVSVVIDGTDNIETRYLINDGCLKLGKPWVYGGVTGTAGMTMSIVPGQGPCFRCIFPSTIESSPAPTRSVLGPIPSIIAGIQATEACKLLLGNARTGLLLSIDLWHHSWHQVAVFRDEDCVACGK